MLIAAIGATSAVLQLSRAQAQWWSRAPADFEECADAAEKAATREERASAFTACNAKFAGRRKPGGGYTYYDFMQNRSFDIAGPNPTPAEQKHIDQQYTAYLDRERQSSIAAAFAAKQAQEQQVSLRSETEKVSRSETEKASPPPQAPRKPRAAPTEIRPRIRDQLKLYAAFVFLRLATAFRRDQGSYESAVRLFPKAKPRAADFASSFRDASKKTSEPGIALACFSATAFTTRNPIRIDQRPPA